MKRHDGLIGLSQDHHHGLVLGRRCLAGEITWKEVGEIFARELEPHFQIEERLLLPGLGVDPLVDRTLADHAALRSQLETQGSLTDFGKLLQEHIRFEERELFQRAQEVLSEDQLAAILAAWPKTADRPG